MIDGRNRLMVAALLVVIFGLASAVIWMANPSPTQNEGPTQGELRTEAVQTYIAQITASAPPPSPTPRFEPSSTPTIPTMASGTPGCLGLRFIRDVTVPDNTEMNPAQVFTKSWQVENSGTCVWKPGFQVVLIGGTAMGGSPFKVAQTVGPGGSVQVSIKMAAPTNQTGVAQGTWIMSDENGLPFGDYLSVVIVVQGRAQGTSTTTVTRTP